MNTQKNIEDIRFFKVDGSDNLLLSEAKTLLTGYGNYMYVELGLTAGKKTFFEELEHFPGSSYLLPFGIFTIVKTGDMLVGCVGIRKFEKDSCEMKRMYITSAFRGKGIGKLMCEFVIEWCRKSAYRRILLDSNIEMREAVALYLKCGFKEIEPYCPNENSHPVFMEYTL